VFDIDRKARLPFDDAERQVLVSTRAERSDLAVEVDGGSVLS
jgi:hypothetical protein